MNPVAELKSLKDYLSYRYFDPKTESFLLANSAAGFLLEICPLVGVNDSVVKNLGSFLLKSYPQAAACSFSCWQAPTLKIS